jgi:hypothetical protein
MATIMQRQLAEENIPLDAPLPVEVAAEYDVDMPDVHDPLEDEVKSYQYPRIFLVYQII